MSSQPLVSIVLPTYNGERYLAESIDSCLKQTYHNWELIIVDDRSTDSTPAIIARYVARDSRIRSIRQRVNSKLPAALNAGFRDSRGSLLTWTSDDNTYDAEALQVFVGVLTACPEVDFVYSDVKDIDEQGRFLRIWKMDVPEVLRKRNCIGACFMYRRRVYDSIGDYRPDMFLIEDYEYWLRAAKCFQMRYLADVAPYNYRQHSASLTATRLRDVGVQQARAQALHLFQGAAGRRWVETALWRAAQGSYEDGCPREALKHTLQCFTLRPYSPTYWRALFRFALATYLRSGREPSPGGDTGSLVSQAKASS